MKNLGNKIILLFSAVALVVSTGFVYNSFNAEEGDKLTGVWEPSHGKARVKISKIGNKYFGKIVWLREPNYPDGTKKVDKNNPDEKMHTTPLLGYTILKDFEYSGKKTWSNGTIYDPENGSTYNCTIKLTNENTIEVRGYIGVSAIGRTDTWTRMVKKGK
jgi:uncharacterized protein (DUF2147 family)